MTHSSQHRPAALVTGASAGIGYELSKLLAQDGYDLVLVARSEDRLREIADSFSAEHGVSVQVIAQDLSQPGAAGEVMRAVGDQAIDVLVNNAGFGTYGPFAESDLERETQMMQLNMTALTQLTRLALDGMTARGTGRILNVASTAAFQPGPLMAAYYASKAYVLSFSEALAEEVRATGITVTALCPGPTATGFQERADMEQSRLFEWADVMDAETVAQAGYRGMRKGKALVIPGAQNKLMATLVRFAPRRLVPKLVRQIQEQR